MILVINEGGEPIIISYIYIKNKKIQKKIGFKTNLLHTPVSVVVLSFLVTPNLDIFHNHFQSFILFFHLLASTKWIPMTGVTRLQSLPNENILKKR